MATNGGCAEKEYFEKYATVDLVQAKMKMEGKCKTLTNRKKVVSFIPIDVRTPLGGISSGGSNGIAENEERMERNVRARVVTKWHNDNGREFSGRKGEKIWKDGIDVIEVKMDTPIEVEVVN
jgi:hypothetical protein